MIKRQFGKDELVRSRPMTEAGWRYGHVVGDAKGWLAPFGYTVKPLHGPSFQAWATATSPSDLSFDEALIKETLE